MTPADLDAIEQRANAATPGPWESQRSPRNGAQAIWTATPSDSPHSGLCVALMPLPGNTDADANAAFIAAARSDVPSLVAEVRRLRALAERFASEQHVDNGHGGGDFRDCDVCRKELAALR